MIIWGGLSVSYLNTGGRFNPILNAWISVALSAPPAKRRQHTVVWTGTEMIIWGGYNGVSQNLFDSWSSTLGKTMILYQRPSWRRRAPDDFSSFAFRALLAGPERGMVRR